MRQIFYGDFHQRHHLRNFQQLDLHQYGRDHYLHMNRLDYSLLFIQIFHAAPKSLEVRAINVTPMSLLPVYMQILLSIP